MIRDGVGFTQGDRLTGHSNFVVAICTLPPTADHPHGLVATGSNDKTILLFELGKLEPVFRLSGHADTGITIPLSDMMYIYIIIFM